MLEEEEEEGGVSSPYFDFVESCLRHKSEMVIYEAAHAIVNMKRTTSRELVPAVSVLQGLPHRADKSFPLCTREQQNTYA